MITIVKLWPGNKEQTTVNTCVNRKIRLWDQLPAEALATFPCKSHIFRKTVGKVSISEER